MHWGALFFPVKITRFLSFSDAVDICLASGLTSLLLSLYLKAFSLSNFEWDSSFKELQFYEFNFLECKWAGFAISMILKCTGMKSLIGSVIFSIFQHVPL
jgi:hypothetical protein